jgi:hypothetical protein
MNQQVKLYHIVHEEKWEKEQKGTAVFFYRQ